MDADRWRRINYLFHHSLERDPDARDAFLDEACGGDRALRDDVKSLLDAHAEPSVIDRPALEADPGLLRHHEESPGSMSDARGATSMDDPLIGQSLGPYEVTGLLGRGGMGVVYRGFDSRLGRPVAIKALPPMFDSDAVLRERLRREAMSAAALSHPGIATVYALEEFGRHLYLVYEYVPGVTLRHTLRARHGLLPIDEVVSIARAIAHALAAAHAGGVIHRDLKPENVMHLPDGRIKVVDFGLARIAAGEGQTTGEPLTRPGEPPGTPGYVAPEILRGEPPDARADQFSFGVLLYELLAGHHPFAGQEGRSTIASVLEDDPPAIIPVRPDCPPELARIATTCLAKAPGHGQDDRRPGGFPGSRSVADPGRHAAAGLARCRARIRPLVVAVSPGGGHRSVRPGALPDVAGEGVGAGRMGTAHLHGGGRRSGRRRQSPTAPLVHLARLPGPTGGAAPPVGSMEAAGGQRFRPAHAGHRRGHCGRASALGGAVDRARDLQRVEFARNGTDD